MNDVMEGLLGLIVCVVPVVVLGGVVVLIVRAITSSGDDKRTLTLELEVSRLTRENLQLLHRLSRVEGIVSELSTRPVMGPAVLGLSSAPASTEPASSEPLPGGHASSEPAPDAGSAVEASEHARPLGEDQGRSTVPDGGLPAETEPDMDARARAAARIVSGTDPAGAPGSAEAAIGAEVIRITDAAKGAGQDAAPLGEGAPMMASAAQGSRRDASGAASAASAASTSTSAGPGGGSAAAAPPPFAPAPSAGPKIDWEQWIGVRGAAALGAVILVIAGIYFFEYSIEHGLITPVMRMVAGTAVGLGCLLASELRLRKTHSVLANWLAGAGVGILYVAFWAGAAVYGIYPNLVGGVLLVVVTAACVTLAIRRDSAAIAVLGLLGGFATPLALSTGSDQPIPLFGYLLLLDAAMLWLAYKQRWPWMALLCLIATAGYQNAWMIGRLDQPRMILGVAIVAIFAVVFAALPKRGNEEAPEVEHPLWRITRSVGVVLPLLFTVPLAARTDLGDTFWATSTQLVLLCIAAGWVGLRHRSAWLPTAAALLASGTLIGWTLSHGTASAAVSPALAVWQLVGLSLALAVVFHVFAEIERRRSPGAQTGIASFVLSFALLVIAALGAPFLDAAGPWPWLVYWAVVLVSVARLAEQPGRETLQPAASALVAIGLGITFAAQAGDAGQPSGGLFLGVLLGAAVLVQLLGLVPRGAEGRRWGDHAAALFAVLTIPIVALVDRDVIVPTWAFYGGTLLLAVLALLVAARRGTSAWLGATLLATAAAHGAWVARRWSGPFDALELVPLGVAVVLFSVAPILSPKRLRDQPWAWRSAALAGPLYLLQMRHVYLDAIGASSIGALPVVLAVVAILAAWAARARGPEGAAERKVALVWLTVAASGFITLAIPLQLENEWITLGWALEALVLVWLFGRFDHAGVKYLAFGLAAVVCLRLVANPYLLDYYPRQGLRVFNWISYTYLVPAACLIGMWALLRKQEVERRRPWESAVYSGPHPVLANLAATAAIAVVFVWLNLIIIDWFALGRELTIPTDRLPARDLSLSMAWAVYAVFLLAIGLWRRSTALRITSLALILLTVGKVFLYDLANLSDLYRVASLVGLAVSLIVISLAYQRFVFRKDPDDAPPRPEGAAPPPAPGPPPPGGPSGPTMSAAPSAAPSEPATSAAPSAAPSEPATSAAPSAVPSELAMSPAPNPSEEVPQ